MLVDINDFPRFVFRLNSRRTFNPYRDLTFTTSMDNPAAFNSMLTTAAYLLAAFRGNGPQEDPLALGQKGEAMRCINRALSDPEKSVSPGTLQSIIWIANVEVSRSLRESIPKDAEIGACVVPMGKPRSCQNTLARARTHVT